MITRRVVRWIRARMTGMYWRCMGKGIGNPPIPRFPVSVLFICQGNVCRSPYAGRYLRKIAGDRNLRGICACSAGLDVRVSAPSPDLATRVAKTRGVELMDHRSKPVTTDMIENTDIIFTMEHRQAAFMRKTFPDHVQKIFLLPLFDTKPPPGGISPCDTISLIRTVNRRRSFWNAFKRSKIRSRVSCLVRIYIVSHDPIAFSSPPVFNPLLLRLDKIRSSSLFPPIVLKYR